MKNIIIATKNMGKAKEFEAIFQNKGLGISTLHDYPEINDVEESGSTFEENARLKAETISNKLNSVVIADDSGLIVDALDGRPGIYSARYAGENKDDQANLLKVLDELKMVPETERTARFYCALAVAIPGEETIIVSGTCEGVILSESRGTNGFGYDPIFYLPTRGKTLAELSSDEKNKISHRANALKNLASTIDELFGKLALYE